MNFFPSCEFFLSNRVLVNRNNLVLKFNSCPGQPRDSDKPIVLLSSQLCYYPPFPKFDIERDVVLESNRLIDSKPDERALFHQVQIGHFPSIRFNQNNCRSLIKVKFFTIQVRPALGSVGCFVSCRHALDHLYTIIQAYMPHDSSENSSNQPHGHLLTQYKVLEGPPRPPWTPKHAL